MSDDIGNMISQTEHTKGEMERLVKFSPSKEIQLIAGRALGFADKLEAEIKQIEIVLNKDKP